MDGKTILILHVPRAGGRQRPVFINGNPLTGTYVRAHEGDRHLDEASVKRMLADSDPDHPRDSAPREGFGISDLDPETLRAYRSVFKVHAPNHPFIVLDDNVVLLRKLGGIVANRESGKDELSLAALLMFGRHEVIREVLPTFHLDYQEIPTDTVVEAGARWVDRVSPDGTWSGNLFSFYQLVLPRLTSGLQVPFQLGPDLIRRDETPVHHALRE